ncbi:MAG: PilZ domain-containing protein [Candidatus Desulfofervidaceae bacterium]|nr:PilZ domain-containing protein [Candidatus Desulfofervidaceae bacterium]MDL1971386.1 PilZ domain-containing protein [Candidatus Desulfofervidaceae bacterium]
MKEKRSFPRKGILSFVFYSSREESIEGLGRILNLSNSGVLIESVKELKAPLRLELDIAIKETIYHVKGTVIWTKRKGDRYLVGVAFDKPQEFMI